MFAVQYGMTGCRFLKLLRACGVHILGILDKPMMISGIMTGLLQLLVNALKEVKDKEEEGDEENDDE